MKIYGSKLVVRCKITFKRILNKGSKFSAGLLVMWISLVLSLLVIISSYTASSFQVNTWVCLKQEEIYCNEADYMASLQIQGSLTFYSMKITPHNFYLYPFMIHDSALKSVMLFTEQKLVNKNITCKFNKFIEHFEQLWLKERKSIFCWIQLLSTRVQTNCITIILWLY